MQSGEKKLLIHMSFFHANTYIHVCRIIYCIYVCVYVCVHSIIVLHMIQRPIWELIELTY